MRGLTFFVVGLATTAALVNLTAPAPGQGGGQGIAPFVTEIPRAHAS